jgi:crotonobetaine/carnitine-CoA ligase
MTASMTFARRWQSAVDTVPDRPFLVFEATDGRVTELTYRSTDRLVDAVAADMTSRGVERGAVVHLVHTNSVAFVAVWLACARLGATLVPSDPRASVNELVEHARRMQPVLAVCLPEREAELLAGLRSAGLDTVVVAVRPDDTDVEPLVAAGSAEPPRAAVEAITRLAVMFTSGTTSAPKGVELTHGLYAFTGDVMAAVSGLTRYDRQFVVLPMFHANAQYYSFAAAISVGASVALMQTFSASRFLEQARRHQVTHASLFAAPIKMILARTPPETEPLSLRHAWFAQNLSTSQYRRISELLGCEPRQIYGMTETGPAVLTNPPIGAEPSSIGHPTLGCQVRVVDSACEQVAPGESGAIHVGGIPGLTLFSGYLDDPATTDAAIVDRRSDGFVWFDTGDRATIDEFGLHYFAGRRSDVLKVGGENVSILEVEHALAEHASVADVAVVGMDDDMLDEVPVAFVVTTSDVPPDGTDVEAGLRNWAEHHLAPSKRPRAYHFVDELPRTSVGKVRKFLLTSTPPTSGGAGAPRQKAAPLPPPKGDMP